MERIVDLVAAKLAVDFSQNVWQNWSDFAIEVSVQRSILPQFVSQKLSHLNRKLNLVPRVRDPGNEVAES